MKPLHTKYACDITFLFRTSFPPWQPMLWVPWWWPNILPPSFRKEAVVSDSSLQKHPSNTVASLSTSQLKWAPSETMVWQTVYKRFSYTYRLHYWCIIVVVEDEQVYKTGFSWFFSSQSFLRTWWVVQLQNVQGSTQHGNQEYIYRAGPQSTQGKWD